MIYFTGIGTVANILLILLGAGAGLLCGKRLPQKITDILMDAAGLIVLFIGVSGLLAAVFSVNNSGGLDVNYTMVVILSLFIGSAIGQLLGIEEALERLGRRMERRFAAGADLTGKKPTFAQGFCMASILFCTGAMAVVGSMNDALLGQPDILYAKGVIDGVTSIVFAATMGPGVAFSALAVGVYEGLITLAAAIAKPLFTEVVIAQMSAVGSLIIVGISLGLLGIKKLKIGNFLPGIFLPLLWSALAPWLTRLWQSL